MTEEVKPEGQEEVQTPQFTEIEQRAMDMGWRPKTEFSGDDVDFVDAKEFVGRKPLFDKIDAMNRTIRNQNQVVDAIKKHYTKVEESAYKRALNDLQKQQKEAIKQGDLEQYHELQEEIDTVKTQAQTTPQIPTVQQEPDPAFVAWRNRNSWYETEPGMTDFADQLGIKLAKQGMEPLEVLKTVEKKVKETFVHKFSNPNRERPGAVEGTTSKGSPPRKDDYPLSEQERKIMNDLVRQKVLTKEQYIADLKKVKGE